MLKRIFMLTALSLCVAGAAFAAGEWEWTAGQGWMRGAGVSRPTPKEQLSYSYELEQRGEFMDAARQYFLLVQNFPDSQEAGVGLQRLARCLFEMENYYTSFKAIEQVIETYPNTGRMSDLVEIELRIAKKLMVSQTPDLLGGTGNPRDHNIRRSIEIIDAVIEHDPYGPVAAEAYLVKGEGHLFLNEVNAARRAFETIRDEFPRSDFVERARLGILTCDSLVGQASPAEVEEQANVVRQLERENAERGGNSQWGEDEEMDSVEDSIRKLAEVEAAKMLEQAEQYRIMGTRQTVESSQFLYREVARRYPNTPQAEEALSRLDNLRMPREENRFTRVVKGINLNPFSYNKDPEPPWIVPQMNAEDQVMLDPGIGPIAGVPETGTPLPGSPTGYSVGVRPANLPEQPAPQQNFSPLSAAPEFIDGTQAGFNGQGGFSPLTSAPAPARNPLLTASDSDLVLPPGSLPPTATLGGYSNSYANNAYTNNAYAPPAFQTVPRSAPVYAQPGAPASLGSAAANAPYSDLIGAVPPPPQQPYYSQPPAYPQQTYPQQPYGYPPQQAYSRPQAYSPPPARPMPAPAQGGRGWTLTEDFR